MKESITEILKFIVLVLMVSIVMATIFYFSPFNTLLLLPFLKCWSYSIWSLAIFDWMHFFVKEVN